MGTTRHSNTTTVGSQRITRRAISAGSPLLPVEGAGQRAYRYAVRTTPQCIFDLRQRAMQIARMAGARGNDLHDIQIAVGEALSNAYRHGSPRKLVDEIVMCCRVRGSVIEYVISDEGAPFDVRAIRKPIVDGLCESGMGVPLMRRLMDKVEIRCGPSGNSVRLVKHLKRSAARAPGTRRSVSPLI